MEDLLTPVSTSYKVNGPQEEHLTEVAKPQKNVSIAEITEVPSSPESALETLRSEPGLETVGATLRYLVRDAPTISDFRISVPSPQAAQIVNVLVTEIVPNYWPVLDDSSKRSKSKKIVNDDSERGLLLSCLRSVAGLSATLLRLKTLIQESKESKKGPVGTSVIENLKILLDLLAALLHDVEGSVVFRIWSAIHNSNLPAPQQKLLWTEFSSLVGGGKILAVAAEAVDIVNASSKEILKQIWVADGSLYCSWLARNIVVMSKKLPLSQASAGWKNVSEILSKSFRLGHTESIVQDIVSGLVLQQEETVDQFKELLENLPAYEQRTIFTSVLKMISKRYLTAISSAGNEHWWKSDATIVSASAGLIKLVMNRNSNRRSSLVSWLSSSSGAGTGDPVGIRRAAVAALSEEREDLEIVLEKSVAQFGDQLYIKHTPVLQQEVHTQVLLLVAGNVHRVSPMKLHLLLRSSPYLTAISNRLAATSLRARHLGMVVGEAMSSLVDPEDKRMNFNMEELESDDSKWYKSLVTIHDSIGTLSPLKSRSVAKIPAKRPSSQKAPPAKHPTSSTTKILSIEELGSDDESEDDDLVSYAKPDSDQEDSDEDATLVTRNKPTAPVYIRDLITYLRNTESYDHQRLALTTAPHLIRRKASFGSEVTAHAEELATLLVGLQDKYDIPNFSELRIQGMIAVLLAQPSVMGPWFAKTFFDGDYSLAQRSSVLTTLGLSARELGGFKDDASLTKANSALSFPSKTLPPKMHQIYASSSQKQLLSQSPADDSAINELSQQLSRTMIQPLAASLADKLSGPDILKVRTFSSRMEVEKKRPKPTSNILAKIAAEAFFLPLTGRFSLHLKTYGASNIIFSPLLLSTYLRTLSIIMHAAGPTAVSLQSITSEFWELLLGLRSIGLEKGDKTVIESMMLGFMTILEVNMETGSGSRKLAEEYGRELLETQSWVDALFGVMGGGSEEDERVRMLGAGVLVRVREVVDKYQALLVGDLTGYR